MAVIAKKEMIQEMIKSGKVQDLKTEKESNITFAKKLYALGKDEIEKLYSERMGSPEEKINKIVEKVESITKESKPEKEVESVVLVPEPKKETKKISKAAARARKLRQEKILKHKEELRARNEARLAAMSEKERALYNIVKDTEGFEYKFWLKDLLEKAGFSAMSEEHTRSVASVRPISFSMKGSKKKVSQKLVLVYDHNKNRIDVLNESHEVVNSSLCICEYIVRCFINKYAGVKIEAPEV